ncbi:MAG TPA: LacI family transcriptional regulator [Firmicutes bacterium]|nr:LacI family transcriptional regulator [Bacillota bacterium]
MKDVSRETGLSLATISKYLNGGNVLDKNKQAIEAAIQKLDFKVNEMARALKTNRSMTVGVLIPNFENIFFTSIVSNIENGLLQEGYSTIVCDYKENPLLEAEKLNFLLDKMVDGIIMMPLTDSDELINEIISKDIPVILIDRMINNVNCDVVLVDNLNASYNAVEQLIIRGHKRIGIIVGPEDVYTAQERLKGYIRVHEDYGREVDPRLIKYGDYQMQSGYELFQELLQVDPLPTAIYVTNYEMTLGAVIAINETNLKIPEDLSVIGFDNLALARIVKPSLSIVVQPMQQIGEVAAQILLKRLKKDLSGFPAVVRLKTELLIRDSVRSIET